VPTCPCCDRRRRGFGEVGDKKDSRRFGRQGKQVRKVLLVGWHTLEEICRQADGLPTSIHARLGDLRAAGYRVEKRSRGNPSKRIYEYRIRIPEASGRSER
jgi:hypothetical protein